MQSRDESARARRVVMKTKDPGRHSRARNHVLGGMNDNIVIL